MSAGVGSGVGVGVTFQSDTGALRRVLLRHAREAFGNAAAVADQWRELEYLGEPDFDAACRESDALGARLEELGVAVEWLPASGGGLDSIYVRDPSVLTDRGAVLARMGKGARRGEPEALESAYRERDVPLLGRIPEGGTLEGGDTAWVAPDVLAVGRGYRTNDAGIEALASLVGPDVETLVVPLPHWRGPDEVFHLMSIFSPLADDLALVRSSLLPIPFRERLVERGIELVEVAEDEYDTQGCNVLAVAPRVAVAVEGNPETLRRMRAAGVEVHTYPGSEISVKGSGGPTCLSRPLEREG